MVDVGPTAPATPPEEMKTNTDMIKMSEEEAGEHSLVALISKMEWRHVMNRVEESPEDTRKKQIIKVDGVETSGYPLHLAVSLKPPVSVVRRDITDCDASHTSVNYNCIQVELS